MGQDLLEIQPPKELSFAFKLKKQSSCSVQLLNNSDHYVAYKVKTTNPKRYSVQPNTGVILPNSTCDFIVIMQAPREAPADLQCKDKFLIQSTVVPAETAPEDIKSSMFSKDNNKYVGENKLRVVIVGQPESLVVLPINEILQEEPAVVSPILRDQENLPPEHMVTTKDMKVTELANDVQKLNFPESVEDFKLVNEMNELKAKLTKLESNLCEAEICMQKLKVEKAVKSKEREMLQKELVCLKSNKGGRRVQVGFPFLFVCMVAVVSMKLGYMLSSW
ncbi:hypothetical protein MKX01_005373 [Papaver californicum]|nr:hypothetical protein MKX01_005373 [Papaver californicum]